MKGLFFSSIAITTLIPFSAFADNCPSGHEMKIVKNEKGELVVTGIPNDYTFMNAWSLEEASEIFFNSVTISNERYHLYSNQNSIIIPTEDIICAYRALDPISREEKTWDKFFFKIIKNNSKGFTHKLGVFGIFGTRTNFDNWKQNLFGSMTWVTCVRPYPCIFEKVNY